MSNSRGQPKTGTSMHKFKEQPSVEEEKRRNIKLWNKYYQPHEEKEFPTESS